MLRVVARRFKFRVREGAQIHSYGETAETHGPGYEFVLPEKEAAALMREPSGRRNFDLVEVIDGAPAPP